MSKMRPGTGRFWWRAGALAGSTFTAGFIHRALTRVRAREIRLTMILEHLPVAVGVMNARGEWILSNSQMRRFSQYMIPPRDPGQASRWRTLDANEQEIRPQDWPGPRALRGGTVFPGMEFRYREDDGNEIWTRVAAAPLRDRKGEIIGAIAVTEDIDRLKRTEQALRDSSQQLKMALAAGRMGVWEWDIKSDRVSWSPHAEGDEEPGVLKFEGGLGVYEEVIHPDDRQRVHEETARSLREQTELRLEYRLQPPGAPVSWIAVRGRITRIEAGTPAAMSGICVDITERKETEENLSFVAREIEHRTRNILAAVKAVVHVTRANSIPEFVQALDDRIDALARTHALLSENRWEGADLRRLLHEEISPYASEHPVRLDGPDLFLAIKAAEPLAMVVHELATNSAKYGALARKDAQLAICWSRDEQGALALDWRESGVPILARPDRTGFGTRMIDFTARQLSGNAEFHWEANGLHCRFEVPAEALAQSTPMI